MLRDSSEEDGAYEEQRLISVTVSRTHCMQAFGSFYSNRVRKLGYLQAPGLTRLLQTGKGPENSLAPP